MNRYHLVASFNKEQHEMYLKELSEMYYRGLMEVDQWIQDNREN